MTHTPLPPGRKAQAPGTQRIRHTQSLLPHLHDWVASHPEGISPTVERMVQEAYDKAQAHPVNRKEAKL